jgi:hypothetical protein
MRNDIMRNIVHFNRNPDPAFLNAVSALVDSDPPRVCAYVLARLRDERLAREGYVPATEDISRLVGKAEVPPPPGDDHGQLYLKNGAPAFYLSQPYSIGFGTIREIVAYCESWELVASIDGLQSTSYPGSTIAIRYEWQQPANGGR